MYAEGLYVYIQALVITVLNSITANTVHTVIQRYRTHRLDEVFQLYQSPDIERWSGAFFLNYSLCFLEGLLKSFKPYNAQIIV